MLHMSTLQHKQVKSQKQHLQILWGRGADIWGQGQRAEGRGPRKTNTLFTYDLRKDYAIIVFKQSPGTK